MRGVFCFTLPFLGCGEIALPFGLAVFLVQILSAQASVMIVMQRFLLALFCFGGWCLEVDERILAGAEGTAVEAGRCRLGATPARSSWGDAWRDF